MDKPWAILVVLLLALPVPAVSQLMQIEPGGGSRPNPDPTVLGLAAQREAIGNVREYFEARIKGLSEEIDRQKTSLDRIDNRIIQRLDEIPKERDAAIAILKAFFEQRFTGVDLQFRERDERVNQIASLNNVALQAALSAAKEAVAKEGTNTAKQLDAIGVVIAGLQRSTEDKIEGAKALFSQGQKSSDDKIAEMRSSVADMRVAIQAITARGAGQSDLYGWVIGGGGLIIAAVSIIVLLTRQGHQQQAYNYPPQGYPPQGYPPQGYPPQQSGYYPQQSPQERVSVVPVAVPVAK